MTTKANPYAGQLGSHDAVDVITTTPGELQRIAEALGPAGAGRSAAAGKWTAREILCHLADAEMAFGFRLRQVLAESHHVIQPYDQSSWAQQYAAYPDLDEALRVFAALRRWNVLLIRHALPAAAGKPVTHPERGEMTFLTIVETMAGHDLHHLRQLEAIAGDTAAL